METNLNNSEDLSQVKVNKFCEFFGISEKDLQEMAAEFEKTVVDTAIAEGELNAKDLAIDLMSESRLKALGKITVDFTPYEKALFCAGLVYATVLNVHNVGSIVNKIQIKKMFS